MHSLTIEALEKFDNQHDCERMSSDVLNAEGHSDVTLIAPRGGSDEGKDLTFTTRNGRKGLGCATIGYKDNIERKFYADFSQRKPGEYQVYIFFCTVVLQKFLSSSKKNVFYNRTKVKRVKDVLAFFRRICFCSNYTIIFDELKNFCNTTISPVFSTIVTTIWMLLLLSLCCLFRSGRLVSLPGEQLAVHRPGHSIRLSGLGYRRAALGADASGPVVVVQLM